MDATGRNRKQLYLNTFKIFLEIFDRVASFSRPLIKTRHLIVRYLYEG